LTIWEDFMVIRFHRKNNLETIFNVQNCALKGALLGTKNSYFFKISFGRHMQAYYKNRHLKFQVCVIIFGYSTILKNPKTQSVTN